MIRSREWPWKKVTKLGWKIRTLEEKLPFVPKWKNRDQIDSPSLNK